MIKNIIFDMGNVLLSYNPNICLEKFLDNEEDRAVIRKELFEGPEWVEGDLGLITDAERFDGVSKRVPERLHDSLRKCTLEWMMCMKPVPGAREFCRYVKEKGYHIYVLSNASNTFYDYFPNFSAPDYFDGMVVSCDIHIIKPDIRIYEHLLKKYDLRPGECFFIDDLDANVDGAKKAGMNGAVFRGDFQEIKELIEDDCYGKYNQ